MITKYTFHAMIVPIIAPTCMNIARPENTCDSPHATSVKNAIITTASTFSCARPSRLQSWS